jgi:hypothetical protein
MKIIKVNGNKIIPTTIWYHLTVILFSSSKHGNVNIPYIIPIIVLVRKTIINWNNNKGNNTNVQNIAINKLHNKLQ